MVDLVIKEQYDEYLTQHIANVKKGYDWLCLYLPELIKPEFADALAPKSVKPAPAAAEMRECDFYEDVRKKAKAAYAKGKKARMEKLHRNDEHEELLFYRQWILDHDLQFELLADWDKWKQSHNTK